MNHHEILVDKSFKEARFLAFAFQADLLEPFSRAFFPGLPDEFARIAGLAIEYEFAVEFFLHATSNIGFRLPPGVSEFSACGVVTTSGGNGVRFIVKVDGNVLHTSDPVAALNQKALIKVRIPPGGSRLELVASDKGCLKYQSL